MCALTAEITELHHVKIWWTSAQ